MKLCNADDVNKQRLQEKACSPLRGEPLASPWRGVKMEAENGILWRDWLGSVVFPVLGEENWPTFNC